MNRGWILIGVLFIWVLPVSMQAEQIYKCVTDSGVVFTNKGCRGEAEVVSGVTIDKPVLVLPEVEFTEAERNPEAVSDSDAVIDTIVSLEGKLSSTLMKIRYTKEKELRIDELSKRILNWMNVPRDRSVELRIQKLINHRDQLIEEVDQYMKSREVIELQSQYDYLIGRWRIHLNRLHKARMEQFVDHQDDLLEFDDPMSIHIPLHLSARKLERMIFGGKNHDVYLGCIDCEDTESDSIMNPEGRFGSCKLMNSESLFCRGMLDKYGSKSMFSELSACSDTAKNPPVIVDHRGKYYGRFVLGSYFQGHKDSVCRLLLNTHKDDKLCKLVQFTCGKLDREELE